MPKEKPILMSGEMVRAILRARQPKTQTRRCLHPQLAAVADFLDDEKVNVSFVRDLDRLDDDTKNLYKYTGLLMESVEYPEEGAIEIKCPYGNPGDRLWVRENGFERPERSPRMMREGADTWPPFIHDATFQGDVEWCREQRWIRRPSIHMAKKFSRLTLEIVDIRVERLQDISEADALAEGLEAQVWEPTGEKGFKNYTKNIQGFDRAAAMCATAVRSYETLWESINGNGSWTKNPWVFVIVFKRVEPLNPAAVRGLTRPT